jgi:hypothetical protein
MRAHYCIPLFLEHHLEEPLLRLEEHMENCSKSGEITVIFRATFLLMIRDTMNMNMKMDFYQSLLYVIDFLKREHKRTLLPIISYYSNHQFIMKKLMHLEHLDAMKKKIEASPQLYTIKSFQASTIFSCIAGVYTNSFWRENRKKIIKEFNKPRKGFGPNFLSE